MFYIDSVCINALACWKFISSLILCMIYYVMQASVLQLALPSVLWNEHCILEFSFHLPIFLPHCWLPAKVMHPANSTKRFSWLTHSTSIFIENVQIYLALTVDATCHLPPNMATFLCQFIYHCRYADDLRLFFQTVLRRRFRLTAH